MKPLFRELHSKDTGITFSNTIAETDTFNILTNEYIYNGGGVAAGDFNNDGLTDLFFSGNQVSNKLFINRGNLKFADVSAQAGIEAPGKWSQGVATVDINADGLLDLYVCATMHNDSLRRENMLFVNQGISGKGLPHFEEMAASYGINDNGWSVNAAFFDYDKDGDSDLYVLTNVQTGREPVAYRPKINDGTAPNNDKLYKNNGDGTFTLANLEAGIVHEGFGLGLSISDINGDSWPDIYVSNDFLSNDLLYINNGDGTFTNKLGEYIRHSSQFSMGNDVADINNDGLVDIVTLDMLPETNLRKKTTIVKNVYQVYLNNEHYGYEYQHVRNMLQLNNGPGLPFSEIGFMSEIFETDWSWAPLLADVDNDGDRDLLITNGFPKDITDKDFASYRADVGNIAGPEMLIDSIPVVKISNFAFQNNGGLAFSDATKAWGLYKPSFSNGAAVADLDNDGDLDYVVNTINSEALVYENTLYARKGSDEKHNGPYFLRIRLNGNKGNPLAIGTKVTLRYGNGKRQFHDHSVYRGFLSSIENAVHFGVGEATVIDSVIVNWYDGKATILTNVPTNQVLPISYADASTHDLLIKAPAQEAGNKLLAEVTKLLNVSFTHGEGDKIDFNLQRTLPHKFTQFGPALAVGDINSDGLDDFITGGSANEDLVSFLQQLDGTFVRNTVTKGDKKAWEYLGLLLFDIDNDLDLDLYTVSGSIEYPFPEKEYGDHVYLNDGKGNFSLAADATPKDIQVSGSVARAADFDKDGDLDVFVGGRVVPGAYPLPARSILLENVDGRLIDVTSAKVPMLENAGMVTDMLWTDYNNDHQVDMVLAGEFMPITFVRNDQGHFETDHRTGLGTYKGWWNSIAAADFDNDGDTDYVAGNLGENNYYRARPGQPLRAYAKDFDNNGSTDLILSCYFKTGDGEMAEYPLHFWDDLSSQSPMFRKMFSRYGQFGKVTMAGLLSKEQLEGTLILEANYMKSAYIENKGDGTFKLDALPVMAQIAPVNGLVATDINHDGNPDLLMAGNDYGNEVFAGRHDAFTGLLLLGDGKGHFSPVLSAHSGFLVEGDGKALVRLSTASGNDLFIASQNKGETKVFTMNNDAFRGSVFQPYPDDFCLLLTHTDGRKQKIELHYGSGFLSQSTRKIRIPDSVTKAAIVNFRGETRPVTLPVNK